MKPDTIKRKLLAYPAALSCWIVASVYAFSQLDATSAMLGTSLLAFISVTSMVIPLRWSHWMMGLVGFFVFAGSQYLFQGPTAAFLYRAVLALVSYAGVAGLSGIIIRRAHKYAGQLYKDQQFIQEMSSLDEVGLRKWEYFLRSLTVEVSRSRRHERTFCVLLLQLANWDQLVDEHGHDQVEELFYEAVTVVKDKLRTSDIGSQYDQKTIAIILPETSTLGANAAVERFKGAVENKLHLTLVAGFSIFPEDGVTSDQLIEAAKNALNWTNESGTSLVPTSQNLE
jgi:diguanylate cyclase (GGDEF)-like protein